MVEQTSLLELFQRFCPDDESPRFELREPFVQDGYLCACDGRIAVWAKYDAQNTVVAGRLPNMAKIIDDTAVCTERFDDSLVEKLGCSVCGGSGMLAVSRCVKCDGGKCAECEGSGMVLCDACEYEHRCEECDGVGSCRFCNGTGTNSRPGVCGCCFARVDVHGGRIVVAHARLIHSLPNVRYVCLPNARMVFEADGGIRGCVALV